MFTLDHALFRPSAVSAGTAASNRWLEDFMAETPPIHAVPPKARRAAAAALLRRVLA